MFSVLLLLLTLPLPGLPVGGLASSSIKVLRTIDSLRDFSGTTGLTLSPNTSVLRRLAGVTVCLRYSLHQCLEFQPLFGNGDFVIYQSGSFPCPWPCTFSCNYTCIENGFYICTLVLGRKVEVLEVRRSFGDIFSQKLRLHLLLS